MSVQFTKSSIKEINAAKLYTKQREDAAAIAFVVLAESGQIDVLTAAEQSTLFAGWVPGVRYADGQLRRYGGVLYRCIQPHTSQEGWEPDKAVSLWAVTSNPAEEWPEWSQPIGAHDVYRAGDKVSCGGKHWISTVDNNVWAPGTYGWAEYTESSEAQESSSEKTDG